LSNSSQKKGRVKGGFTGGAKKTRTGGLMKLLGQKAYQVFTAVSKKRRMGKRKRTL